MILAAVIDVAPCTEMVLYNKNNDYFTPNHGSHVEEMKSHIY